MPIDGNGGNAEVVPNFVGACAAEAGLQPSSEGLVGVAEAVEFGLANQMCGHVREMYGDAAADRIIARIDSERASSALPAFDLGFAELATMGAQPHDIQTIADRLTAELEAQRAGVASMLMQ